MCTVDGCGRDAWAKGLCNTHYARMRRLGSPGRGQIGRTVEERFWEKVDKGAGGGCWLWTSRVQPNGYGQFWIGGSKRNELAHRMSVLLSGRVIPEGMQVDHLCFTRLCVRPDHLDVVTPAENTRRSSNPGAMAKRTGRCKRGHDLAAVGLESVERGYRMRRCGECKRIRDAASARRRRARLTGGA